MSESKELALPLEDVRLPGLPERFQPKSLTELMSWSKLVVSSGLGPKGMNEAGVVLAVQMGAELNITPTQALQNIAVINGRPSVWGDLGKAIFQRDARYDSFEERPPQEAKAKGEGWCRIVMKDGTEIIRTFSRADAQAALLYKRSGDTGPWTTYEGRMLQMRARWFAMRDAAPGVFKGVASAEESQDMLEADYKVKTQIQEPRRKSEGVVAAEVDSFVKGMKSPATAQPSSGGSQGGTSAPVDRSKLKKVLIANAQEKKAGNTTFYIVTFEGSSGGKVDASTFSSSDYEVAVALKGKFAMLSTKESEKKDAKGNPYINLAHIEAAPEEVEAPTDEPGSQG